MEAEEMMRQTLRDQSNTLKFISAIEKSDRSAALLCFSLSNPKPLIFRGHTSYNPFKAWSMMTSKEIPTVGGVEVTAFSHILDGILASITEKASILPVITSTLLVGTCAVNGVTPSASPMLGRLNEIDRFDGCRPIDVATHSAAYVLVSRSKSLKIDLNPTISQSPLHRLMTCLHSSTCNIIIESMRPEMLDWEDQNGRTALHLACSGASGTRPNDADYRLVAEKLILYFPWVNPFHRCFTVSPITGPREIVELLAAARANWTVYKAHVHSRLATHTSLSNVGTKENTNSSELPLVKIVVDYLL